jgi:hypothetical protein
MKKGLRIREILFSVTVAFRDRQRRMQEQPAKEIAYHAKPPSVFRHKASVHFGQGVFIGNILIRTLDTQPERKRLTRLNDKPVQFCGSQFEVGDLFS